MTLLNIGQSLTSTLSYDYQSSVHVMNSWSAGLEQFLGEYIGFCWLFFFFSDDFCFI